MVKIYFRVDASLSIGSGHVIRCLTLANALVGHGAQCTFICRTHEGNLLELIEEQGHKVFALAPLAQDFSGKKVSFSGDDWLGVSWEQDAIETCACFGDEIADWLVVDHYSLDYRWEKKLKDRYRQLMVIDDLADRNHACDVLLDQNLGRKIEDYSQLVPSHAVVLAGPHYALLRKEFSKCRLLSLNRRSSLRLERLLITMGGVDKENLTGKILDALSLCDLSSNIEVTVVLGRHSPWVQK
ncbi:UDP-2,4-diacetamido-2,4,6-trideoxy-beta-L-altropyranose hydrolase [Chromobacterium vaccinii]|uniref:UDP-2,4-diacetamido-2,4, 6-trideoxy-beta-L-altropyranose hydrolase n=1 Tax=Chromobacterium vaccinii TaxID=1108595 RepID=UPI001C9311F2|nr:UDP-2,4-diacetamido-2,4,6-trideoxy-beta-L-altropyranose hydrolase [Chromobacterium vaccinii]